MKISDRIKNLNVSPIRKLKPYCDKCKEKNIKVIGFNIGQPDIETPKEFFKAISEFDETVLSYADSQGIPELINSTIEYFKRYDVDFEYNDIIVTQGASEALTFAMATCCDENDEILLTEPFYANYKNFSDFLNIKLLPIPTYPEDNFSLPAEGEIQKLINPKVKAILITNPSNPTGKVLKEKELERLVNIAYRNNLFIISDEVYKEFIYCEREKFISMGKFTDFLQNIIIIDSISKRYSCCGARIGTVSTKNKKVFDNMLKLAQSRLSVATLEQVGAAALNKVPLSYFDKTLNEYKHRKELIFKKLSEMEGVVYTNPEGAFYTIVKLPVDDAEKFIIWTLENISIDGETILLTPAKDFYLTEGRGINEVRIAYCVDRDKIERGMEILKLALKKYPNNTLLKIKENSRII